MKKAGFTLVELLVVVAVIGIIVGIIVPLVSGMTSRTRETESRELCIQTADAWNTLAMRNSRLPHVKLIQEAVGSANYETVNGDLCIVMTPAAGSLLNEWVATTPVPKADLNRFHPTNAWATSFQPRVAADEIPTYKQVVGWPADTVLERDVGQKRFGLYAPWVKRRLRDELGNEKESDLDQLADSSAVKSLLYDNKTLRHGLVSVLLDTNADGILELKKGMAGNATSVVLRARAAAWVWNEEKDKASCSW